MTDARAALAEKIARVLAKKQGEIHDGAWKFYLPDAEDALDIALEEAARIVTEHYQ